MWARSHYCSTPTSVSDRFVAAPCSASLVASSSLGGQRDFGTGSPTTVLCGSWRPLAMMMGESMTISMESLSGARKGLCRVGMFVALTIAFQASAAPAANDTAREAGVGVGSAFASLLYAPTKLVYATLGVVFGGLAWGLSGGDEPIFSLIPDRYQAARRRAGNIEKSGRHYWEEMGAAFSRFRGRYLHRAEGGGGGESWEWNTQRPP